MNDVLFFASLTRQVSHAIWRIGATQGKGIWWTLAQNADEH